MLGRFLLFATCVVALMGGPALAQSPTPWSAQAREVDFDADADGFRYTSTRAGHAQEERLMGQFRLADASFEWSFQPNASAQTFTSRMTVVAILEWQDADKDGRLGVGDPILRRQRVADLGNATIETLPRPPDGRVVHATYPFPGGRPGPLDPLTGRRIFSDAGLTLSFHILGSTATIGSLDADPTDLPLEIRIEKWPRTRSDSLTGLEIALQSGGPMRVARDAWRASGADVGHDAAWTDHYTTNGTNGAARVAGLERPGAPGLGAAAAQTTLLAAYQYGNILHSFSLGTEPQTAALTEIPSVVQRALGDSRTYLTGMAAALLIVGVSAVRKLRAGR